MFYHIKKSLKNSLFILHIFLDLITNLLKPLELGLHFKNTKNFISFSISIRDYKNLYVRRILNIK